MTASRQTILPRAAFSLVEVLVCLAVLGLLTALALPAIQRSRAAGSSLQCRNHLRQLGLAVTGYHDTFGYYPRSYPLAALLPFLEQRAVYDRLAQDYFFKPNRVYTWIRRLAVYVCPADSDTSPDATGIFRINYRYNMGYGYNFNGFVAAVRAQDITDGLSNTACMSEQLLWRGSDVSLTRDTPEARRMIWYVATNLSQPNQFEPFLAACESGPLTNQFGTSEGPHLLTNDYPGYDHNLPPNRVSCFPDPFSDFAPPPIVLTPTSEHAGGVNLLLCDGSVRFMSNSVNRDAWHALGTRDGREPTGAAF